MSRKIVGSSALKQTEVDAGLDDLRSILRAHDQRRQFANSEDANHWNGEDSCLVECPATGSLVYRVTVSLGNDFLPEEVRVRVDASERIVMVEAEHSEAQPGRKVQRRLTRSFQPPPGTDLAGLESRFSLDKEGNRWLSLEAPFLGHPVIRRLL